MSDFGGLRILVKREFRFMVAKCRIKYLIVALFFAFIALATSFTINGSELNENKDLFFEIFKGEGYFKQFEGFKFPSLWFLCNILGLYIIQDYVQDDIKTNAIYVISRCGREKYWISKVIVAIMNIFIYYFIVFFITYFIGLIFSNNGFKLDFKIVILYFTTSLMLILFNMCISLKINYKYSFLIVNIILIISVFSNLSILPGQQSLILRHAYYCQNNGITLSFSVLYNLAISVTFIVLGIAFMKEKDIR